MDRRLSGRWLAVLAALAVAACGGGTARGQEMLVVTTAELPMGEAGAAYSAQLEATGGTPPYSWRWLADGEYTMSTEYEGTYEETGTFVGEGEGGEPYPGMWSWWEWGEDTQPKEIELPFGFPFFGKVYTTVQADYHGVLLFGGGTAWSAYNPESFSAEPMISVGWNRWDTSGIGGAEGLWVESGEDEVTVQWRNAFQYHSDGYPIVTCYGSFSATLRKDGTIVLKYAPESDFYTEGDEGGEGGYSYSFGMTGGISAGDGTGSLATDWPQCGSDVTFSPPPLPAGLVFGADGSIGGTPAGVGEHSLTAIAIDSLGWDAEQSLTLRVAGEGMCWDEQGKWTYTVADDMATVTSGPTTGDVVVPAALGGHTVVAIGGRAFYGRTGLTSVTLPDTVTSIGGYAFNGCQGMTNAVLGGAVRRIGDYAFNLCTKMVAVEGTGALESIGNWAFNACNALAGIELPEGLASIGEYAFQGAGMRTVEFPASLGTIGQYAFCRAGIRDLFVPGTVTNLASRGFWDNPVLTNVTFGAGTKGIPWGSFDNCTALRTVTLPEGLLSVGSIAFRSCPALEAVEFPESLTGIGERAFLDCRGLSEVRIPAGVEGIGDNAFAGCTGLTNAVVESAMAAIPLGMFDGCRSLAAVSLAEGATSIGAAAFRNCAALPEALIPGTVTNIGANAFAGCVRFAEVSLGAGVTGLGTNAFAGCTGMTNAVVGASVESVPAGLFDGCTSLVSVALPAGATSIGNNALRNCAALPEVTIPDGVESIGAGAFQNCAGLGEISIPCSVTNIGANAFAGCTGLQAARTPSLACWLGIRFADAGANPLSCAHRLVADGAEVAALALPDGAESVGAYAFSGATGVASVDFGAGVTQIGSQAFAGCTGLTEVSIPDQVAGLGMNAFSGCTGLAKAEVPAAWWGTGIVEGAGLPEGCVVTYRGMEPLEMVTEALARGVVGEPYAEALEAKGGTEPYAWSVRMPAVYTESAAEGSTYVEPDGTAEPDASWFWNPWSFGEETVVALPFPFQFFDGIYTNVRVNAEGCLSFGAGAPSYCGDRPMIVAFWPDSAYWEQANWEGNIQVFRGEDEVTVHWNGQFMNSWEDMNFLYVGFSVTLRRDGTIVMKYGQVDTAGWGDMYLAGTVGLFAGDGETELHPACSEGSSISWASDVVYSLPPFPAGLEWTPEGAISGTPEEAGDYELIVRVEDASGVGVERTMVLAVSEPSSATRESPVPVPYEWLEANAADILAANGGDYEAAAMATGESGRVVWECYVSGASLEAGGDGFKAWIWKNEAGEWKVSWSPDQNAGLETPVRAYRVEAKKALTDEEWTDVTGTADFGAGEWRFFRVAVGM